MADTASGSYVLSLAQAEDLAARTLAALDYWENANSANPDPHIADRERVASDLDGLRNCDSLDGNHAARYSAGLLRTAALYGVTP